MADVGLDTLAMWQAIINDDKKQAVLDELVAQLQQIKKEREALEQRGVEVKADADKAAADRRAAEAARTEAQMKAEQIARDTDGLRSATETHNREAQAFATMREKIERDHDAARDALTRREAAVADAEANVQRREAAVAEREGMVASLSTALARKHEALQKALAA